MPGKSKRTVRPAPDQKRPAKPRVQAYRCKICGRTYTEKTKLGHARMFGHDSFVRIK